MKIRRQQNQPKLQYGKGIIIPYDLYSDPEIFSGKWIRNRNIPIVGNRLKTDGLL